jgi:hypothetical protein
MAHTARWLENSARGHKELYHSTCRSQASQVKIGYIRTGFEGVDSLCRTHRIILYAGKGISTAEPEVLKAYFQSNRQARNFGISPFLVPINCKSLTLPSRLAKNRGRYPCVRWKATVVSGGDSVDVRDGLINFQVRGFDWKYASRTSGSALGLPSHILCSAKSFHAFRSYFMYPTSTYLLSFDKLEVHATVMASSAICQPASLNEPLLVCKPCFWAFTNASTKASSVDSHLSLAFDLKLGSP